MTLVTECFIPGHPKTKGSLTSRNGRMVENVIGSGEWRRLVRVTVRADRVRRGLLEPAVGAVGLRGRWLMPVDDVTQARSGDLDKLIRNVMDALQDPERDGLGHKIEGTQAYRDDVQVVKIDAVKVSAVRCAMTPGLLLMVWQLDEDELEEMMEGPAAGVGAVALAPSPQSWPEPFDQAAGHRPPLPPLAMMTRPQDWAQPARGYLWPQHRERS